MLCSDNQWLSNKGLGQHIATLGSLNVQIRGVVVNDCHQVGQLEGNLASFQLKGVHSHESSIGLYFLAVGEEHLCFIADIYGHIDLS